jgi:hypothetical protein
MLSPRPPARPPARPRSELGRPKSLLTRLGFWRVVLDEAQMVANSNSAAAAAASSLWRRHAWVVTGTVRAQQPVAAAGLGDRARGGVGGRRDGRLVGGGILSLQQLADLQSLGRTGSRHANQS